MHEEARQAAWRRTGTLKETGYELFLVLLSLLSVANSLVVMLAVLASGVGPAGEVVLTIDAVLTPIFLFDFLYRLTTSRPPRRYFFREGGWADLIAVVPVLRAFRLLRCYSVARHLRQEGSSRVLGELSSTRARSTFLATIFLVVVVVECASAAIYYAEKGRPGSNITSAGDAIWFALVTITTVGYGDYFPVTTWGRISGVFLLFAGVGLFSVLTGFIANTFLAPRTRPRLAPPPGDPRASIVAVRGLLEEQEDRNAAIRRRLDELERLVVDSADGRRSPSGASEIAGQGERAADMAAEGERSGHEAGRRSGGGGSARGGSAGGGR